MRTKYSDEWSGIRPSPKDMGLVEFILDEGIRTSVVGTIYGLDFDILGEGYNASIHFDYYNRRLKILDYDATDYTGLTKRFAWLADANGFDKIFLKAHASDFQQFLSHGYMLEGILRYYYRGEDAYVLSRFSSMERVRSEKLLEEAQLIETLIYGSERNEPITLDPETQIILATEDQIPQLVLIYRSIFPTYPSPITKPDYIKSLMNMNVIYRLAMANGNAIGAASADINIRHSNAELTDCAVLPEVQGKSVMKNILSTLEDDLREHGIMTAYTLARATSIGMNKVFFKLGYEFSGRLINNCDISGSYEDMNIWVKKI